jgi:septum formation protein
MSKIVLASGSINRQRLLKALGIPFKTVVSDFDEKSVKETNPQKRAAQIALGKAEVVTKKERGIIIACDTFTVCQGQIMEKPKDLSQARSMLKKLSGNFAINYSGFCFLNTAKNIKIIKTSTTKIKFRKIYKEELAAYLKKFPVTSWAAAYAPADLYGLGLIEEVHGSLTGLTHGLPLEFLIALLAKEGFKPKPL